MMIADGYTQLALGKLAAVVTYLEMNSPSPRGDVEENDVCVELVQQTNPDPDWYLGLFREIGAPWLWTSRLNLTRDELIATLNDPGTFVYAAHYGDKEIGLVELSTKDYNTEIRFFGLKPAHTGRRIGPPMMAAALDCAWQLEGTKRVWLHTCTLDHPAALKFYQACGLKPYARSVEVLDDPRLSGLLPRTAAPHIPLIE